MSSEDKPDTFAVFHVLTNEEAELDFENIDRDKKGHITQEDLLTALRNDVALAVRLHLPGTEGQQEAGRSVFEHVWKSIQGESERVSQVEWLAFWCET